MTTRGDLAELIGRQVRVFSSSRPHTVMGEGRVLAICFDPSITLEDAAGNRTHHSASLPREILDEPPAPPAADSCGQCGQRTPVCVECGDSIIFVPRRGFGNTGDWRHREPPRVHGAAHQARPKVFVS